MYECMTVFHLCTCCLWRSEESIKTPGTGVTDVWAAIWTLEIDPGSSENAISALDH